jgi:hypothetical protein
MDGIGDLHMLMLGKDRSRGRLIFRGLVTSDDFGTTASSCTTKSVGSHESRLFRIGASMHNIVTMHRDVVRVLGSWRG